MILLYWTSETLHQLCTGLFDTDVPYRLFIRSLLCLVHTFVESLEEGWKDVKGNGIWINDDAADDMIPLAANICAFAKF